MDKTLAEEFEDLNLIELFQTHKYPDKPDVIKSSKSKDAVLYQGYYYNFLRHNAKSDYFKCRAVIEEKECPGSLTLSHNGTFKCMPHNPKHRPMVPIESDVKKIKLEMDEFISSNPTASVSKQWDKKVIELSLKYSEREVAFFCPEFNQVDSAMTLIYWI